MDIDSITRLEGCIKLRRRLRTDGDEAVVQELLAVVRLLSGSASMRNAKSVVGWPAST